MLFGCSKKADDKKGEEGKGDKKEAEAPKVEPAKDKKALLEALTLAGYKKGSITDTDAYGNVNFTDEEKSAEGFSVNISINANPCDKLIGGCKPDEFKPEGLEKGDEKEKRVVKALDIDGKKAYLVHIMKFEGAKSENWAKLVYPNGRFMLSINMTGSGFATTSEADLAKMDLAQYEAVATELAKQIIPLI